MLTDLIKNKIIFILFNITIFILLLIQLFQLTKQFLLPALRKYMSKIDEMFNSLKLKLDLTNKTQTKLKDDLKNQEISFQSLESKINEWHNIRKEKKAQIKKEQVELSVHLKEKRNQQYKCLQFRKIKEELIPEIIETTRKKLEEQYEKSGKSDLTKLIKELK